MVLMETIVLTEELISWEEDVDETTETDCEGEAGAAVVLVMVDRRNSLEF